MKKMFMYAFVTMLALAPVAAFGQVGPGTGWEGAGTAIVGTSSGLESTATVSGVLGFIITWLLYILGGIAVLAFIIAGIMYITAGGDEAKVEKAKGIIVYSIIGIVVALLGLVILRMITSLIGGSATSTTF